MPLQAPVNSLATEPAAELTFVRTTCDVCFFDGTGLLLVKSLRVRKTGGFPPDIFGSTVFDLGAGHSFGSAAFISIPDVGVGAVGAVVGVLLEAFASFSLNSGRAELSEGSARCSFRIEEDAGPTNPLECSPVGGEPESNGGVLFWRYFSVTSVRTGETEPGVAGGRSFFRKRREHSRCRSNSRRNWRGGIVV